MIELRYLDQLYSPAILVGYCAADIREASRAMNAYDEQTTKAQIAAIDPRPAWLFTVKQQVEGSSANMSDHTGAILRLEQNSDRALRNPARLFALMRYDDENVNSEIDKVFNYTFGNIFNEEETIHIQRLINTYFRLPEIESGVEALLEFKRVNPLEYFRDWHVLGTSVTPAMPSVSRHQEFTDQLCVSEDNVADFEFNDDNVFDEHLLDELRNVGRDLGIDAEPRVYMFWMNSD